MVGFAEVMFVQDHVLYPATGIDSMEDIDSLFTTMENNYGSNGCHGKKKGGAFHMDKF